MAKYYSILHRGGRGSRKSPKKYYVIFAQPLRAMYNNWGFSSISGSRQNIPNICRFTVCKFPFLTRNKESHYSMIESHHNTRYCCIYAPNLVALFVLFLIIGQKISYILVSYHTSRLINIQLKLNIPL